VVQFVIAVAAISAVLVYLGRNLGQPEAAPDTSQSAPSSSVPVINTINQPADIFTTLGVAGLGCPTQPTQLAAGAAHVALCSPIAGIPNTFLTIGMYTSPEVAAREYRANCGYGGWSLYRPGQNWRGAMGPPGSVPERLAKQIATAVDTDLRPACLPQSTPPG
jgi:hypothetical protein